MQTKKRSLNEAITNIVVGYLINLGMQIAVFPLFNIHISLKHNLGIGAIFTIVSLIRSYVIRRFFNLSEHI